MGGSVEVSGGVVVSVRGADGGDGSDFLERPLKRERSMEDNVSFRILETFGVVDARWGSRCESSAVAVAFALVSLLGSKDCFHCLSM